MAILVVGTDFSTRSDRALRRATLLARRQRYDLLLAHVVEAGPDEQLDAKATEAATLLRRMAREIEDSEGIGCETDVRFGSAAEKLAEVTRQRGAELMLIGPHRREPLRDRFSRTTGSRIIRRAQVPLIAANGFPAGDYRRALLPTDLHDASRRAATMASSLPFLEQTELILLHVFDAEARESLSRALVRGSEREDYVRYVADEARAKLVSFANEVGLRDARCLVRETSGSVAADVISVAADEEAELMVLSRSNKGSVAEVILGSVTEGVLRDGERDVLLVPDASAG